MKLEDYKIDNIKSVVMKKSWDEDMVGEYQTFTKEHIATIIDLTLVLVKKTLEDDVNAHKGEPKDIKTSKTID